MAPLPMVRQRGDTSCGVACAAMLAREESLVKIRQRIHFGNDHDDRTYPKDLRSTLKTFKRRLGRAVKTQDWSLLIGRRVHALAAIRYRKSGEKPGRWHWVVFDGYRARPAVLDPEKGLRRDFGRMRLHWYHLISHVA